MSEPTAPDPSGQDPTGDGARPTGSAAAALEATAERVVDALLVDDLTERLDAFRKLAHDDDAAGTEAILQQFGARGKAEADIVQQLAARRPLYLPDRFEDAHRMMMRSLEVLDRNGARSVPVPRWFGPIAPIASFVVQLVARFIVRNHQADVITGVRNLYLRREANAAVGSSERSILRRARIDAERVLPTLKKNPLGVPTALLGGAAVSSVSSALSNAIDHSRSRTGLFVATAVLVLVFGFASWCVLRGAAVARHRISLALDQPSRALWEVIGAAGHPPKDSARTFALVAISLMGVALIVLPIGVGTALLR